MGVLWLFKKYMDEIYIVGMGGVLCVGDGCVEEVLKKNYGIGGIFIDVKYMMFLIFNVLEELFNDSEEFFEGKFVDDLLFLMYMNFKFFGMKLMEIFVSFDVMKNVDVENDFKCFEVYIYKYF